MNDQVALGQKPIGKLLLKYSIPAIVGMLVNALYNVVDRIFIGNIPDIGALAITGLGITMPILTVILAFAMLIGIGSTSQISIKLGQGKKEEAEKIVTNGFFLAIVVGALLTLFGLLFLDNILMLFGASENTLVYAKDYVFIILIGCIFNLVGFSLSSNMRADGNPVMAAATMVIGCVLNIILDALFVGVEINIQGVSMILGIGWGIKGAAIATIISQIVTAIISIQYFTSKKSQLKLHIKKIKIDGKIIASICAIGMAPFAMQLAASLVQALANNALRTTGGELAIGSMTAIGSIAMMFQMPIFGINQGAQPIIGFNYGAKKYDRAKKTVLLAMMSSTVILIVGFIAVQSSPQIFINMFTQDRELIDMGVKGIRIYLLTLPILGVSIIGTVYFQAIGKAMTSMILSLLRQTLLLIPLFLILPKFFGLEGVWWAQPISDGITAVIVVIVLIREFRLTSGKSATEIED